MHPDDKSQSSPERALLGASDEPNSMGGALLFSRRDHHLPSPMLSVSPTAPSASMFAGASVAFQGGSPQFVIYEAERSSALPTTSELKPVFEHAAPNAILNAGGRADEVRCHPGTREEVLAKCEGWMDAGSQIDNPRSGIFWLSGPAGAGKSAIMQALAERAAARRRAMLNFFFFRNDSTRNDARPLVATLLVQLFDLLPKLKLIIFTVLADKPMIFRQSIRDQFHYLIDEPVRALRNASPSLFPIVLLIDGLDECSSETKSQQQSLLKIIYDLISRPDSSFVALIASRPEPHLTMTFNEIGSSSDSIFLNEDYQPEEDILKFVSEELGRIKAIHHLGHTLDRDWPLRADVDAIVKKSSGQFIYAATVLRFIAGSSASPAHSLDKVQGLQPIKKSSPFAELDMVYTYILSHVDDWEFTQDILAMQILHNSVQVPLWSTGTTGLFYFRTPLGYSHVQIASSISDLTAIATLRKGSIEPLAEVQFYHASFSDFLLDETRSGIYHVSLQKFCERSVPRYIEYAGDRESLYVLCNVMTHISAPSSSISKALLHGPQQQLLRFHVIWPESVLQTLAHLHTYCAQDEQLYERIVQVWIVFFRDHWITHWDNDHIVQLHPPLDLPGLPEKSRLIIEAIVVKEIFKRYAPTSQLAPSPRLSGIATDDLRLLPRPQNPRSAPLEPAVTPLQHLRTGEDEVPQRLTRSRARKARQKAQDVTTAPSEQPNDSERISSSRITRTRTKRRGSPGLDNARSSKRR